MRKTKRTGTVVSLIYRTFCISVVLLGLFGIIRLRSAALTIHHDIRSLEEQKMSAIRDMKVLAAEREKYRSMDRIKASFSGGESAKMLVSENEFGSRVRLIKVRRRQTAEAVRTSVGAGIQ